MSRPRVIVSMCPDATNDAELALLRRRIAELDAELEVVPSGEDEVMVLDHRGGVRFSHRPERLAAATLCEAIEAAAEAQHWRDHHTPLERVQWSAREWAIKCLVVGCALTFGARPTRARQRFARGTGPITRVAITASADAEALPPQETSVDHVSRRDEA